MRAVFLINSLQMGGAENFMISLARYCHDKCSMDVLVISLLAPRGDSLVNYGDLQTVELNLNKYNFITKIFELRNLLKREQPDILSLWLYHSVLIGLFASLGLRFAKVVNIRQERINAFDNKFYTFLVYLVSLILYPTSNLVIGNADKFIARHPFMHLFKHKCRVIYNGVAQKFCERPAKRDLPANPTIGVVGRIDPEKNLLELFEALHLSRLNGVMLKIVGPNVNNNLDLTQLLLIQILCYPHWQV